MSGGGDKTQVAGDQGEEIDIPLGVQLAVYATGTFGNTVNNVVTVILPLWAIHLNASPLMIGLILGARHLLTMVFSIHGGALMDRLGTRRVLVWFAAIGALTPFLFPIMPWLWAVVVLQMLGGISSSFAWMGAQALVGQIMRGSPLYAGRLSFVLRIGHLAAPLAAGISWDLFGPWGGFTVLGLWGLGVLLASLALPKPEVSESRTKLGADDLMPRLSDYTGALRMMAVPAIALVVMASTLRMSGQGMHGSFYVVYLEGIDLSGTLIGVLLAVGSLVGFAGAISVAPLARRFSGHWLLIGAVAGGVLCIAVTPLLGGIFLALLLVAGIRGGTMALAQPLMISILSGAAGRDQGKGVGMRTTANRLVSFAVPVIMGGVVELVGLENSFYVVGGVLIALCVAIAVYVERTPELGRAPDG
jgi:MFS family permease